MHAAPYPVSQHRLQRVRLWTLLYLTWIAFLLAAGGICSDRAFKRITPLATTARRLRSLVYHLAHRQLRAGARASAQHRFARSHYIRALFGARLRKRLNHRDLITRVARMIRFVRNLDAEAARFAKRLKRGLTRYHTRQAEAELALSPSLPPCGEVTRVTTVLFPISTEPISAT